MTEEKLVWHISGRDFLKKYSKLNSNLAPIPPSGSTLSLSSRDESSQAEVQLPRSDQSNEPGTTLTEPTFSMIPWSMLTAGSSAYVCATTDASSPARAASS